MHKTNAEGLSFISEIENRILDKVNAEVIFCPPFTSLFSIVNSIASSSFSVGAQNVHNESQGAFTGEISVNMLESIGVKYVILGHSERRSLFSESDLIVNNKIHSVKKSKITPLLCIGETLEARFANETRNVLKKQIESSLKGLVDVKPESIVIAYEPIWAIGTGENATVEQIEEAHFDIKSNLRNLFGDNGSKIRIIYGGSVNEANAESLIKIKNVDGFLIGGASLKVDSVCKIIEIIEKFY